MIDYNALGQIIDTTWGRSSTPKTSSYSVKFIVNSNTLTANFATISSFFNERDKFETKRLSEEEGKKITKEAISYIKKKYKEMTGENISLSEISSSSEVEIIGLGVHNPKRTAYFKLKTYFDMK